MNKGYIVQANTHLELHQAELLATSIKIKNKDASVCLVTNKNAQSDIFDYIVEYPFYVKENTRENDWQLYWATPYEYTIVLDCKCVVMQDQETLWDYLIDNHSVCLPTQCTDFRLNILHDKFMSKYEQEYNYKKVYANIFYFDKSDESLRYFKILDPIMQDWKSTQSILFKKQHQTKYYDYNLMHTICANSVDFDVFGFFENVLQYIDMQVTVRNNYNNLETAWTDVISCWHTDYGKLKLQNYSVNNILYYHEDNFYNEDLADDFRNYYSITTK